MPSEPRRRNQQQHQPNEEPTSSSAMEEPSKQPDEATVDGPDPVDPMEAAASGLVPINGQLLPMAKLVIEEPRMGDEALYKCDVTYVKGKCPSISLVRLQMMALPSRAQILLLPPSAPLPVTTTQSAAPAPTTNSHQQTPDSVPLATGQLIGPYNEHDQLKLVCLVQGGKPAPKSVSWRKIDSLGRTINLATASKYLSGPTKLTAMSQQPAVEVQLNHTLTSADLGARFECHVEHEAIEEPPARVVVTSTSGAGGNSEQLAASPNPLVHNEDAMLDLHPGASSTGEGTRTPADANLEAAMTVGSRSKSLDSHVFVDLNVGVASLDLFMAKVNRRNSSEPLKEGDLIELECVAYNSKPPANITWFNGPDSIEQLEPTASSSTSSSGGQSSATAAAANNWHQPHQRRKRLLQRNQVHQNGDGQTFNTHSFLSIKLSRHENKAQIRCQAENAPMRQPLVKSIELQVQHAPIVLMEPANGIAVNEFSARPETASMTAQQQGQVSIYCIYSANPSDLLPNSTRWFKDGQQLELGSAEHMSESLTNTGYPVLTISQVHRRHAGLYDCQLANSVGSSERLPASEACKLEVNFRPLVRLRAYKIAATAQVDPEKAYQRNELTEVDTSQELVVPGASYVLGCEVLEAKPAKIHKFHWQRRQHSAANSNKLQQQQQQAGNMMEQSQMELIGTTETPQIVLRSLAANFTPSAYSCSAFNALGPSELSNQIDLQLSYLPGPSHVRSVNDPSLRRTISRTGSPVQAVPTRDFSDALNDPRSMRQTFVAGRELLLECYTSDLGQPSANEWLWFKNGQTIKAELLNLSTSQQYQQHLKTNNPSNTNDELADDLQSRNVSHNPITGHGQNLSPATLSGNSISSQLNRRSDQSYTTRDEKRGSEEHPNIRLISSGRYLFIPSIRLAHKGNYSCVAVNRLGMGSNLDHSAPKHSSATTANVERDSYQLRVALAPSFVHPLAARTYWPEISSVSESNVQDQSGDSYRRVELTCHVQCDPICQIEWLRNNEPIDLRHQIDSSSSQYVTYQVKQSIVDENLGANQFKSIQSKFIIQFPDSLSSSGPQRLSRDRILERRALLNGSNYTCQSSPNSMGPPVRSTTKFVVQYPPENVLINAPSDKLSLVEGTNGPKISCEASGEPQVQYRWFLVRGDLGATSANPKLIGQARLMQLAGSTPQSSNSAAPAAFASDHPIDQLTSKALDSLAAARSKGVNDALGSGSIGELNVIELTGSASEQPGGGTSPTISTLDTSNLNLDRRQSGHYICEASNKLGHARQSVYVNILYKPTCKTLHLHSLDLTIAPQLDYLTNARPTTSSIRQRIKPYKPSSNDEYSLVRDTSDDFIDLRKVLVLSPLLIRHATSHDQTGDISFRGSIFQTILSEKTGPTSDMKASLMKDSDALNGSDEGHKSDNNHHQRSQLSPSSLTKEDSWDKFNSLLLKFLNNYVRQIKKYEEDMIDAVYSKSKRIDRRQGPIEPRTRDELSLLGTKGERNGQVGSGSSTKNLLTFACLAQDANPMSNLTFDWSFDGSNLPETGDVSIADDSMIGGMPNKPMLIYSNDNYTLHVMLTRRMDSHASLNPFQMSLITLNVVLEPTSGAVSVDSAESRASRQSEVDTPRVGNQSSRSKHSNVYHGNLKNERDHASNDYHPSRTHHSTLILDEYNWQEQLGNLLRCRITNQVGTSEACHVSVNIAERLKMASSSSSEFAKWRMPSLASKSLLIISILIGCILIIVASFILLLGPHLKTLVQKKSEIALRKEDNNTGQSTSSQKSSVLGLLGNGDSSIQGSSDDDSSARLNHVDKTRAQNMAFDMDDQSMSRACQPSEGYTRHLQVDDHFESAVGFDEPREVTESRMIYHVAKYNESDLVNNDIDSYRYRTDYVNDSKHIYPDDATEPKIQASSASRGLLSNLKFKSLSKFKVTDRISDISNLANQRNQMRNLHQKTVSNSGTNTTGLSGSTQDSDHSIKMIAPHSIIPPKFFGQSNLRHSHSGFKRPTTHGNLSNLEPSYYLFEQNGLQTDSPRQLMMRMNPPRLPNSKPMMPTYSNMSPARDDVPNAMEDFIRQKELDAAMSQNAAFYRSNSVRNQHDLSQFYPQPINRGPPNHPRDHQLVSTIYRTSNVEDNRPQVVARSSHRQIVAAPSGLVNQEDLSLNNRFNIPTYNRSFMPGSFEAPLTSYTGETIDSHLNRMSNTLVVGHYSQQSAYANAPTLKTNPYSIKHYNNNHQSVEHIYDVNAYATPEQTPIRRQNNMDQTLIQPSSDHTNDRPRVSQLIQSFNSKAPDSSP